MGRHTATRHTLRVSNDTPGDPTRPHPGDAMPLPITITPRHLAAAVGALLLIAGVVALLWPVSAVMDSGPFGLSEQVDCGNALITTDVYGAFGRDACASALGDQRAWGWPAVIAGALVAGVALFVNVTPQAREDA